MARSKKSRKIGLIGVRKDPDRKPGQKRSEAAPRPKKHKGKPPGTRHNIGHSEKQAERSQVNKDPRHGSKKPIPLVVNDQKAPSAPTQTQKVKYSSPSEELAALEADQRLASLLDKLDANMKLTKEQQAYVDEKMARHRILCDLLGIVDEDDEEDVDLVEQLNPININDFKD